MAVIMRNFNIHYAKTHLSRLVEEAADGEAFIIAKAGRPMVKVVPLDAAGERKQVRIGFMPGVSGIPSQQEFNDIGANEIAAMFGGGR